MVGGLANPCVGKDLNSDLVVAVTVGILDKTCAAADVAFVGNDECDVVDIETDTGGGGAVTRVGFRCFF